MVLVASALSTSRTSFNEVAESSESEMHSPSSSVPGADLIDCLKASLRCGLFPVYPCVTIDL